jgi:2-polyprenyl-3-methyl-5-hydroxy-6-metoxy-1,4-benzoquinol methylase
MYDTDKHWKSWGRQDPYFAVLSDKKFRKEHFDRNREEFFASGAETVSGLLSMAASHFGKLNNENALDFGSGVGRLTITLSHHFRNVLGVEISEAMIEEAKGNCIKSSVNNVEFVKSNDQLPCLTTKFDFVISCLVLQHIPTKRGLKIIARLAQSLDRNGVIALQFPVRYRLPRLERLVYRTKQIVPVSRYLFNLLQALLLRTEALQSACGDRTLPRLVSAGN